MKDELSNGCDYPVEDLDESTRLKDLNAALEFGNHKSVNKHEDHLSKALEKEIQKGWGIILLEKDAKDIPGLEIAPMGVAERLGIAETGEYVPKKRITHDLSWPGKFSEESINYRIDLSQCEPIILGHCL